MSWQRLTLAVLAGLVLASSGCSLSGSRDERNPEDPVASVDLEQGRAGVRSASAELFDALLAAGSPLTARGASFAFANGAWGICTDNSEAFAYDVSARIDLRDGGGSSSAGSSDARPAIEKAMSEAGWDVDAEPVLGDAETSVTARRGDYRARVYTSADQPFFLVKVFGVCQPVTADERDRLRQVGPEPLELTA